MVFLWRQWILPSYRIIHYSKLSSQLKSNYYFLTVNLILYVFLFIYISSTYSKQANLLLICVPSNFPFSLAATIKSKGIFTMPGPCICPLIHCMVGIEISESNDYMLHTFTIRAKREKLRRLKDVAAYNVAQYLSCDRDVEVLQVPISE